MYPNGGRHGKSVSSNLYLASPFRARVLTGPGRTDGADHADSQRVAWSNRDGVGRGCDCQYEARLAVGCWLPKVQAPSLANGKPMRTGVLADLCACHVHDLAGPVAEPLLQKSGCVSVGDEADVVTVRLIGDGQASSSSLGACVGLQRGAQRKV